jgi:hypothetical protein
LRLKVEAVGQLNVILPFIGLPGQGFSSKVSRCPVILKTSVFSAQVEAVSLMNYNNWLYYSSSKNNAVNGKATGMGVLNQGRAHGSAPTKKLPFICDLVKG